MVYGSQSEGLGKGVSGWKWQAICEDKSNFLVTFPKVYLPTYRYEDLSSMSGFSAVRNGFLLYVGRLHTIVVQ
jgi:hypothetical protein